MEYRGSIVGLAANTQYDIGVSVYSGQTKVDTGSTTFTTWTDSPTIATTHNIADVYKGGQWNLTNVHGDSNGWIRFLGDGTTVIDSDTSNLAALRIANCRYVILENLIIRGGKNGIYLGDFYANEGNACDHIRIINCDIAEWGRIPVSQGSNGVWLDKDGTNWDYEAGIRVGYSSQIVIERCYIHDPRGKTNTWAGPTWTSTHPFGPTAIALTQSDNSVICYNDLLGTRDHSYNDVIQSLFNGMHNGGPYRDTDLYGNIFAFSNDDGIELDGGAINIRVYKNRFTMNFGGISTNPTLDGPSYSFRNVFSHNSDATGFHNFAFKMGGSGAGRSFIFHNTIYVQGEGIVRSSNSDYRATINNNIIHCNSSTPQAFSSAANDPTLAVSDYDLYYGRLIPGYPSNEVHGVNDRPTFTNSAADVLTLQGGSKGINIGTVLNNFSDGSVGAPDAGAFEYGENGMIPYRPISAYPDQYRVAFTPGVTEPKTVTFSAGTLAENSYTVRKSPSMSWLIVRPSSGKLTNGTTFTLSVNADRAEQGVFFIRFANGYSIPIVVDAAAGSYTTDFVSKSESPNLQLSTRSLDFGEVPVQQTRTLPVSIANDGADTLRVANITSPDAMFIPSSTKFDLIAGTSFTDSIRATAPPVVGIFTSIMVIASNSGTGLDTIALKLKAILPSVNDDLHALPTDYALDQNYPNPFNPSTVIRYALLTLSHVTLTVYSTLGQIVCELVNADMNAGYHEVRFNATGLASGVYYYRLQAGAFVSTKKMFVLK